jgi:hypothetical protein
LGGQFARRFSRACSTPRSEKPNRSFQHLAGLRRPAPHQTERPQGGRPDPVEVQPGAAGHQPPVVPEQLTPVAGIALDVHRQGVPSTTSSPWATPGVICEVGAQRDRRAVGDADAALGEVDDQAGVAVGGERVPVHRALRAHGELAADAGTQGGRVVARLGRSSVSSQVCPSVSSGSSIGVTRK